MSKLLVNEHPLIVLPTLATKIGLNQALFLQQIHYWISHKKAPEKNGIRWHYATHPQWLEDFPFWSESTLKRIIRTLKDLDLIIVDQHLKSLGNRVNWYSVNYEKLKELEELVTPISSPSTPTPPASGQNDLPIITKNSNQPGQVDLPIRSNCTAIYKEEETKKETKENDDGINITPRVHVDPKPENKAVVRFFDMLKGKVEKGEINAWVNRHGEADVEKKIEMFLKRKNINNAGGWLEVALRDNWVDKTHKTIPNLQAQLRSEEISAQGIKCTPEDKRSMWGLKSVLQKKELYELVKSNNLTVEYTPFEDIESAPGVLDILLDMLYEVGRLQTQTLDTPIKPVTPMRACH